MTKALSPRRLATDLLLRIEEGAYAHLALKELFTSHSLRRLDRSFITELVYGTVRRRNSLDYIINHFVKEQNLRQEVRVVLRMGVYQLRYMRVPASAAVNESVKLIEAYNLVHLKGFVNAVLRNIERAKDKDFFASIKDPVKRLSLVYAHPTWITDRMIEKYGLDQAVKILDYNNRPSINSLRVNTLKISTEDLAESLREEGHQVHALKVPDMLAVTSPTPFLKSPSYAKGHFMIQSASSVLAALFLGGQPGMGLLDACAAPGGKSFVLAQLTKDEADLVSTDLFDHKIELMKKGFAHLGIKNARPEKMDWTQDHPAYAQAFDRVLVDAPCSGLGMLAKRADSRWRKKASDLKKLQALQRAILTQTQKTVKPGGYLLYSTCTLTTEENQAQRQWFLDSFPHYSSQPLEDPAGLFTEDKASLDRGELEILPSKHQMDGFYLALFKRDK